MKHLRNTRQRQLVLEAVKSLKDHPTADELYLHVRTMDSKISRGTIYRNLKILSDCGDIQHVHFSGAERIDWRAEPHDHMICLKCGLLCDAPLPYDGNLDQTLANASGFQNVRHRTVYEGLCPDCANQLTP